MLRKLRPDLIIPEMRRLDAEWLVGRGIRGLFIDVDNTLVKWHSDEIDDETMICITQWQKMGLMLCILSNNSNERVARVAMKAGLPYVCRAGKPLSRGFHLAAKKMGLELKECAMLGDQLLTDVWGASFAGVFSILVCPRSGSEALITKINRFFENRILKLLKISHEKD